jgi:hypothetical protein
MTGPATWEVVVGGLALPLPGVDQTPPPLPSVDGPAQAVVTIPIAGPAPYNTLAIARGRGVIGSGPIFDDELHPTVWRSMTHLHVPGIDHDRPLSEQLVHSTTASILTVSSLDQLGPEHDGGSDFLIAIDAVRAEAYVDETTGRFGVDIETVNRHDQTGSVDFLEMTTWVMYYDPATKPLDEQHPPLVVGREIDPDSVAETIGKHLGGG